MGHQGDHCLYRNHAHAGSNRLKKETNSSESRNTDTHSFTRWALEHVTTLHLTGWHFQPEMNQAREEPKGNDRTGKTETHSPDSLKCGKLGKGKIFQKWWKAWNLSFSIIWMPSREGTMPEIPLTTELVSSWSLAVYPRGEVQLLPNWSWRPYLRGRGQACIISISCRPVALWWLMNVLFTKKNITQPWP